jgi:HlyD family secretion protein
MKRTPKRILSALLLLIMAVGVVYVFRPGSLLVDTARRHAVEVGHRNAREAEIVDGVEAGEEVVFHPSNEIKDGVRTEGRLAMNRRLPN